MVLDVARGPDGVAVITMNRPDKLNAMGVEFFQELPRVLADLDADRDVGAAVLTGAGRAFSAGGDIESFSRLTDHHAYRQHLRLVFDAFHAVEMARIMVIGAINGIAFGGGTELTLACDFVIAAEEARFGFREVTVGLTPGWGVIRGPEVIGRSWTRRLALGGEIIDARRALDIGLVQEVVAGADLLDQARALAARVAGQPQIAAAVGKQLVNRGTTTGFAESIEATALLFTTEDHKRAVTGFLAGERADA
ncbi:MAG: enoyl-CoA hydratase/isomerase family protein [Nostocoides sp.]